MMMHSSAKLNSSRAILSNLVKGSALSPGPRTRHRPEVRALRFRASWANSSVADTERSTLTARLRRRAP
jgi:hypothetical protein